MIVSKTPYRVSFFGGGTDFPLWYKDQPGAVLSTTIDKYCYVMVKDLPPYFPHRHRVSYSVVEYANQADEIKHPSVRETLLWGSNTRGLDIHHSGDLPARSGIGSSSSFTVGLLKALYPNMNKDLLAKNAINIEQGWIEESVGSQDQVAAAHGGLNLIEFYQSKISVKKVDASKRRISELNENLMLFYTKTQRISSDIAKETLKNLKKNKATLREMYAHVYAGKRLLEIGDVDGFGRLLHESWVLKRKTSDLVSNSMINDAYAVALSKGALGGKLLGAGQGGFMLFYMHPEKQSLLRDAFKDHFTEVPFKFEEEGSTCKVL